MYPERIIRGIPNDTFLDPEGPSAHLFYFNKMIDWKKGQFQLNREDGFFEESICWYDDEESLQLLLSQIKENKEKKEYQFKSGAVILLRKQLDLIRIQASLMDRYKYERRELVGNKYHGNLLCHSDISIPRMKQIAASVALLCVERIIPNEDH